VRHCGSAAGDYTLLDVVYSGERECFYVLDLICWRQQPMYECESEFRFYWLATQFEERADALHTITKNNRVSRVMQVSLMKAFVFVVSAVCIAALCVRSEWDAEDDE
jgi:hypothetical protein